MNSKYTIFRFAVTPFCAAYLLSGCLSSSEPHASTNDNTIIDDAEPIEIETEPMEIETEPETPTLSTPTNILHANIPPQIAVAPLYVYDAPSPNYDPRTLPISLIILHYTATRNLSEALNTLRNPNGRNRVSAHYVVNTDGTIYRLVPEQFRAWHAGSSWWNGIKDVNSASIGIEIVNRGPLPGNRLASYPNAQIESVIRLCQNIQSRHHIADVIGHSDIAPTRKLDPGENFPWKRLAKAGVGVWTDEFMVPTLPDTALLSSIGYDASNYYFASQAFRRHYFPEGLTVKGIDRTSARLAAVAAEFAKKRKR